MTVNSAELKTALTPQLLSDLHAFWYSHIPERETRILPDPDHMKRWFSSNADFDTDCANLFRPALEAIRAANADPDALIAAVEPKCPKDWQSLVMLLDQIPRNCYRGAESAVVFTVFDPLALSVARRAIDLGVPSSPGFRYFICQRMWFYLPLMHSEDVAVHEKAVNEYQNMIDDFRSIMDDPLSASNETDTKCGQALAENREAAERMLAMNYEFEAKHRDIIARFGRYPHRNGPLGRESTQEEKEYLENGGETFAN